MPSPAHPPIVFITGATAGFGLALSRLLVASGYAVIGTGRRHAKLTALQHELGAAFYPLAFDIQVTSDIDAAIQSLPEAWRAIDVLVNNAGLALGLAPAQQTEWLDWERMILTNVMGLSYLTHQLLPSMVAQAKGHIINLGSIAGAYSYPGSNVYGATKAFVEQFSRNLRADLLGTPLRVTHIAPGLCGDTEFSQVRFHGDETKAAAVYANIDYLTPIDIANTIKWAMEQPAHVNINTIELMPTAQACGPLALARHTSTR